MRDTPPWPNDPPPTPPDPWGAPAGPRTDPRYPPARDPRGVPEYGPPLAGNGPPPIAESGWLLDTGGQEPAYNSPPVAPPGYGSGGGYDAPRGYQPPNYPSPQGFPAPNYPPQQNYAPTPQNYTPQPGYDPPAPYGSPGSYGPPPAPANYGPRGTDYRSDYSGSAPQYQAPRQGEYAAPVSRPNAPPPRWGTPAPIERPTFVEDPPATHRPVREAAHRQRHAFGWSLPIEHIVLAAGIVGMFLALTQPWGVDAHGNTIYLSALTYRAGYYTIGGLAVLGGLLALLNRRMGCLAMIGCLGLFVIPIVVAATVGGIEVFTQLHVVPHLTSANVQGANRGFFLWWGGLAVTIVGLLFEVITHRRKGLLGI